MPGKKTALPVLPFTRLTYDSYHDSGQLYSKADLCSSLKQAADLGAAGVLVWGSYFSVRNEAGCSRLWSYVSGLLGPVSVLVRGQTAACGRRECGGRGRCVEREFWEVCSLLRPFPAYRCDCRPPASGPHCRGNQV